MTPDEARPAAASRSRSMASSMIGSGASARGQECFWEKEGGMVVVVTDQRAQGEE